MAIQTRAGSSTVRSSDPYYEQIGETQKKIDRLDPFPQYTRYALAGGGHTQWQLFPAISFGSPEPPPRTGARARYDPKNVGSGNPKMDALKREIKSREDRIQSLSNQFSIQYNAVPHHDSDDSYDHGFPEKAVTLNPNLGVLVGEQVKEYKKIKKALARLSGAYRSRRAYQSGAGSRRATLLEKTDEEEFVGRRTLVGV